MRAVRVVCPAKINTFLSVGPPDATGYHPLRTVLESVSLCDDLVVAIAGESDAFVCGDPGVPEINTVTRALRLAREFAAMPPLRVELTKRIPIQSGMGGGSSDAAGLLRALDVLFPSRLSAHDRHEIARAVGADVPYFLVGGRARAEGYGERLVALDDGPRRHLAIGRPPSGLSTPKAFGRLDACGREWREFPALDAPAHNDFRAVAPEPCARIETVLRQAGAVDACLCGSGSAVFGVFDDDPGAAAGVAAVRAAGFQAWCAHTLTRAESLQWCWDTKL